MTEAIEKAPTNTSNIFGHGTGDYTYNPHYGPLAQVNTTESQFPAFCSELQPGLHKAGPVKKGTLGNPAPLGLCGFALTTFIMGCINMGAMDITEPNMVVGAAYVYGGLVQLCAGMWAMAEGNTFSATALSSYGAFWISLAITFTPGGFKIMSTLEDADNGSKGMFYDSLGLFLFGWFIFTFLLVLCTLKSTFVFCGTFVAVAINFLLLAIGYVRRNGTTEPNQPIIKAGGLFGLLAAFQAWYVAFIGLANDGNSFFVPPVLRMPWAEGVQHVKGNWKAKEVHEA